MFRRVRLPPTATTTTAVGTPTPFRTRQPRQDIVVVEGEDQHGNKQVWLARLLTAMAVSHPTVTLEERELVLLRYFEDDNNATLPGLPKVRALREEKLQIASASSIVRRALLHPHPNKQHRWLYNHFV
jgi:hypothetical protein